MQVFFYEDSVLDHRVSWCVFVDSPLDPSKHLQSKKKRRQSKNVVWTWEAKHQTCEPLSGIPTASIYINILHIRCIS